MFYIPSHLAIERPYSHCIRTCFIHGACALSFSRVCLLFTPTVVLYTAVHLTVCLCGVYMVFTFTPAHCRNGTFLPYIGTVCGLRVLRLRGLRIIRGGSM